MKIHFYYSYCQPSNFPTVISSRWIAIPKPSSGSSKAAVRRSNVTSHQSSTLTPSEEISVFFWEPTE